MFTLPLSVFFSFNAYIPYRYILVEASTDTASGPFSSLFPIACDSALYFSPTTHISFSPFFPEKTNPPKDYTVFRFFGFFPLDDLSLLKSFTIAMPYVHVPLYPNLDSPASFSPAGASLLHRFPLLLVFICSYATFTVHYLLVIRPSPPLRFPPDHCEPS